MRGRHFSKATNGWMDGSHWRKPEISGPVNSEQTGVWIVDAQKMDVGQDRRHECSDTDISLSFVRFHCLQTTPKVQCVGAKSIARPCSTNFNHTRCKHKEVNLQYHMNRPSATTHEAEKQHPTALSG